MTKEKLAKLRAMGLVFDEVFDEIAERKELKILEIEKENNLKKKSEVYPNSEMAINKKEGSNFNQKEREKKSIDTIRKEYSKYLNGLQVGSQELNALLNRSGFTSKASIIACWERKGFGSIALRFSKNDENESQPDRGHDRTGATSVRDPYYLHPDGNNSIDGAYAAGSGVLGGGGQIVLAKTFLTFEESLHSTQWVTPGTKSFEREDLIFNYSAMKAAGFTFINRIISHEMTHVGADINGLTPSVIGQSGTQPLWITVDGTFNIFNTSFTMYHRGDMFENEAYQRAVTFQDAAFGFAVNVYFRALGRMDCSVAKNPILLVSISDAANKRAIWNYISANLVALKSFKPNNNEFPGGWTIPVSLDH